MKQKSQLSLKLMKRWKKKIVDVSENRLYFTA